MGVYIKNMDIPTNCWFCPIKSWDDNEYVCPFSGRTVKSGDVGVNRYEDCLLIELPDHGDLIDKNELMKRKQCVYEFGEYKLYAVDTDTILNMPVVIPAEKGEE